VNYNNTETGEQPNSVSVKTDAVAIYPAVIPAVQGIVGQNGFGSFILHVTIPSEADTAPFDRIGGGITGYKFFITNKTFVDGSPDNTEFTGELSIAEMGELDNEGNYTLTDSDLSDGEDTTGFPSHYSVNGLFEVEVAVVYGTGQNSDWVGGVRNKLTIGPRLVAPVVSAPFGNDEIEVSWTHAALPPGFEELYELHYAVGLDMRDGGCGTFTPNGNRPLDGCDRGPGAPGVRGGVVDTIAPIIFPVVRPSDQIGNNLMRGELYTVDVVARYTRKPPTPKFGDDYLLYENVRAAQVKSGVYPTPVGIENLRAASTVLTTSVSNKEVELSWDEFMDSSGSPVFRTASGYRLDSLVLMFDSDDDSTQDPSERSLLLPDSASGFTWPAGKPGNLYKFKVAANYRVNTDKTALKPAYQSNVTGEVFGGVYPRQDNTAKVRAVTASRDNANDAIDVTWTRPFNALGTQFKSELSYGVKDYDVWYCMNRPPVDETNPNTNDCKFARTVSHTGDGQHTVKLGASDGLPRAMRFTNILVQANYEGKNNPSESVTDKNPANYTNFEATPPLYLKPETAEPLSSAPTLAQVTGENEVRVSWTNPAFTDFISIEQEVNVTVELCLGTVTERTEACVALGGIGFRHANSGIAS